VSDVLEVDLIDDVSAAHSLVPAWDALAVAQALPLCAPGWMLAWWQHLAPAGSELRIVALRDGAQLIASLGLVQLDRLARYQDVQTLPAYRGRGLASALLAIAADGAVSREDRVLAVSAARALAEHGYVDRSRIPADLDPVASARHPGHGAEPHF